MINFIVLLTELRELIYVKCLEQCTACNKYSINVSYCSMFQIHLPLSTLAAQHPREREKEDLVSHALIEDN